MSPEPVQVQFIWHLHQPYYGLPNASTHYLPWVRLHAIKSYYDMACTLRRFEDVRCVVNFSGSLLEQLREYVEEGRRDQWWDLSLKNASALDEHDRRHLLRHFFSINWEHCVRRYPRYAELLDRRGRHVDQADLRDFDEQDFRDLQVWFNLAWFGFSARDSRPVVRELIDKGRGFTESEKEALLEQQIDVMKLVVPTYRELHRRGQIELSVTPMYHPILPLVIDTEKARRATPERPTPPRLQAAEDAEEHVVRARVVAREFLSVDVDGMWPAEGAVSPEAVRVFDAEDVRWIASDEDVLRGSRGDAWDRDVDLYQPWRLQGHDTTLFFRDHGISDKIGFVYAKNDPEEATRDFLNSLRDTGGPLVSVILDGENPWEHYPDDGRDFLDTLFGELSVADDVETTYPSRYLAEHEVPGTLDELHSGSWIMGNYQIWIGHEQTNRGWEYLGRTREDLVARLDEGQVDPDAADDAWRSLYVAEGSDWFWWYGDDFTSENDADFDRLFREHLRHVYGAVGLTPPTFLDEPITPPEPGDLPYFDEPQRLINPRIDGETDYYYEWEGAGLYTNTGSRGSMFESTRLVDRIWVGFDLECLFLRVDYGDEERSGEGARIVVEHRETNWEIHVRFESETTARVTRADEDGAGEPLERVELGSSLELAIPFARLGLEPKDRFGIWFAFSDPQMELERHPSDGVIELEVPDRDFEMRNWIV